jgi:DNA-binding CsgD family transcriptional regulator/energy-coupling factor transporter ATP-binding protein EcfA2
MYPSKHYEELVGRSQEIGRLHTLLHRVQQSQGQVVLIVGEAGIGKTRLLAYLSGLAETIGFTVLRGECLEQDQNFPYAPIIDGLRTHFSGINSEELKQIVGPFQQEIVKLLPELALRAENQLVSTRLESEAEKRRLFEVLIQVYQRLTTSGLLLIFEDIHWSDANSLEFFQALTRRISRLPVMVALSTRLTPSTIEVAGLSTYIDRAENAQSITLKPLTENESEALVKALLQTADSVHPYLLEKLNTLAQGNPLYTEQLVYMLLQNRQINLVNGVWMITSSGGDVAIPTSIAQTVETQLGRLNEDTKQVLQFAAVTGREFELSALQRLTGFDEAHLTALVKDLIRRHFFEEVSRDRFTFRHTLLRQAINDSLLIRERQALHQSLLHILEESEPTFPDTRLAELSYHAHQAEVWQAALRYGILAGQRALALHSPRAAVEHFSHAIEAADQLREPVSWELYMQRGKAYDDLGEFQSALNDYESALHATEDSGDPATEWQALIAMALLWSARDYHRAEAYCLRALALAQSIGDPKLVGHSLNRIGNWYLNTGQPFAALDYHEQALDVFDELNDLPGKGETLDLLGMTSGHVLQLEAQQDYYRDAVVIFRTLDDRKALASTLANLALCTLDPALAEEAIDIAHQIGWYSGEAYACVTAGYVLSFYGQFIKSLSYLQRSLELAQAIEHTQWLAGAHVFSGFVYHDLLELETAVDHVEKGIALATAVSSHWYVEMGCGLLAHIRVEQGQLDAAADLLAQHAVPDPPAMQHLMALIAEAELALAHGDVQAALSSSERLRRTWPLESESGPLSVFVVVPYLTIQVESMAISDRLTSTFELLQHVRRLCENQGLLTALWRVDVLLGQVAMQQQDEETARQCFQRARISISQMADHVPPDLRQRFRQQAEKLIPSSRQAAASSAAYHQLTPRETDIAQQIALGKTNQQIADELFVTVKTVEAHITRILSKLNMTSRTQIALWAVDNKLIPPAHSP